MAGWLRRVRGALGMGITWAVGWAGVGVAVELVQEIVPGWNGALVDIWPVALGALGLLSGTVFAGVLAIAGRRRHFDEMSLPGFTALGGVGGLLISAWVLAANGFSPAALVVTGVLTSLCAGSAAGSLSLARMAEDPGLAAGDATGMELPPGGP